MHKPPYVHLDSNITEFLRRYAQAKAMVQTNGQANMLAGISNNFIRQYGAEIAQRQQQEASWRGQQGNYGQGRQEFKTNVTFDVFDTFMGAMQEDNEASALRDKHIFEYEKLIEMGQDGIDRANSLIGMLNGMIDAVPAQFKKLISEEDHAFLRKFSVFSKNDQVWNLATILNSVRDCPDPYAQVISDKAEPAMPDVHFRQPKRYPEVNVIIHYDSSNSNVRTQQIEPLRNSLGGIDNIIGVDYRDVEGTDIAGDAEQLFKNRVPDSTGDKYIHILIRPTVVTEKATLVDQVIRRSIEAADDCVGLESSSAIFTHDEFEAIQQLVTAAHAAITGENTLEDLQAAAQQAQAKSQENLAEVQQRKEAQSHAMTSGVHPIGKDKPLHSGRHVDGNPVVRITFHNIGIASDKVINDQVEELAKAGNFHGLVGLTSLYYKGFIANRSIIGRNIAVSQAMDHADNTRRLHVLVMAKDGISTDAALVEEIKRNLITYGHDIAMTSDGTLLTEDEIAALKEVVAELMAGTAEKGNSAVGEQKL